jgi:hypothetical protein
MQKGEGESKWYEYIATYVDDVLVFSKDPMTIILLLMNYKKITFSKELVFHDIILEEIY